MTLSQADLSRVNASIRARALNPVDDGYDVILVAGQSNASGVKATPTDTRLDASDPRIYQWGLWTLAGQPLLATVPLQMPDAASGLGVSPALSFARWYAQITPLNRRVLIVGAAYTGSGFDDSASTYSWHEDITGTYSLRENAVAQTLAALEEAGDNARLAAILWVQGERDAELGATGPEYEDYLDGLIDYFREELDADTVPFVIGQMVPDYLTESGRDDINAVQIDTPNRKTYTGFAYGPEGLTMGDLKHYTPAGARSLGRALMEGFRLAKANVTAAQPITPTGLTLAQSGSDVLATWDRMLTRVTDYTVRYRVTGAGSWTDLVRAQSIDNHATITVTKGQSIDVQVAAVNENGTSAWSATTVIVTVTNPAQVTGLATGTPLASTVPLTWNAAARATSYIMEYKLDGAVDWTEADTVTTTSGSVSGLTPGSTYDFRVTSQNDAGTGTASTDVSETTTSVAALLTDVSATAWFAYGTRKLRTAYAGSALRVRRATDDTEQDIGFDGGGNLDEAALLTFAAGGSCFITKWYSQSTTACNIAQTAVDSQPRIVLDGVIDKVNGRPAPFFDGVDDYLLAVAADGWSQIWGSAQAQSYLAVVAGNSNTNNSIWTETGLSSTTNYQAHYVNLRKPTAQYRQSSIVLAGVTTGTEEAMDAAARVISLVDTGGTTNAVNSWVDGAAHEVNRSATAHAAMTLGQISVGAFVRSSGVTNFLAGNIGELVIFRSALSGADRQAGETNMADWHATA